MEFDKILHKIWEGGGCRGGAYTVFQGVRDSAILSFSDSDFVSAQYLENEWRMDGI